jgi:hypothetical protein
MDGRAVRRGPWLALFAALAALAALVSRPWWRDTAPDAPPSSPADTARDVTIALGAAARPESGHDAERAKLEELRAMSETFRNTTFLIAIRDAGFMCIELVSVYGGLNESTTWTATCNDMLAYTVSITGAGALAVAPMPQYLDGLTPRPIEQQPPVVVPREPR